MLLFMLCSGTDKRDEFGKLKPLTLQYTGAKSGQPHETILSVCLPSVDSCSEIWTYFWDRLEVDTAALLSLSLSVVKKLFYIVFVLSNKCSTLHPSFCRKKIDPTPIALCASSSNKWSDTIYPFKSKNCFHISGTLFLCRWIIYQHCTNPFVDEKLFDTTQFFFSSKKSENNLEFCANFFLVWNRKMGSGELRLKNVATAVSLSCWARGPCTQMILQKINFLTFIYELRMSEYQFCW